MGKLVILKVERGSFEEGYEVTLKIGEDGERPSTEISGKLPSAKEITENYLRWRSDYLKLDSQLRARAKGAKASGDPRQFIDECRRSAQEFRNNLNRWLTSENREFQKLRETLLEKFPNRQEVIRVLIQTEDRLLKKLPWHEWDLFSEIYTNADVAVSISEYDRASTSSMVKRKSKVRILAILGNNEGINIKADRKFLESLPGADVVFLPEKSRKDLTHYLWEEKWEIIFFAGHSSSEGESGHICINKSESITVSDLKRGLKKAIENGLQLAIFNSCDGSKLAQDLADLHIPQVIVMREPVPDRVAQEFLKHFLTAYALHRKPLYLSVRQAREKLRDQGFENESPGCSWLPVVWGQNPAEVPLSWQELGGFKDKSVFERWVAFGLASVAIFVFIFLFYQTPSDRNILSIIRFLLAVSAGLSASFLLSSFRLENRRRWNQIPVRFLGGFSTFIAVFFLSLSLIPGESILLRNLTGINEYPTLGLVEESLPGPLAKVLDVKTNPIIDTSNPVYQAIQLFRSESGNQDLISKAYSESAQPDISYVLNQNNRTVQDTGRGGKFDQQKVFKQSRENFNNDTIQYQQPGQGSEDFSYTSALAPIKLDLEDAIWTSIVVEKDESNDSQITTIIQFPKLLDIKFTEDSKKNNDGWMKNVVKNNPDIRGFLGFSYAYLEDRTSEVNTTNSLLNLLNNCGIELIGRNAPSPYIRFVDIKNNSFSMIKLESIKSKIISKNPYKLTVVDERDTLFQDISAKTNNLGISIPPEQHIFIPIEFGFDTRGIKKLSINFNDFDRANISKIIDKNLYFEKVDITEESSKDKLTEQQRNEILKKLLTQESKDELTKQQRDKLLKKLFISVKIPVEFISQTKLKDDLMQLVPNRFAVGSLMDIISVRIDGKDIPIDAQLNDPRFSMSVYFAYGSCPYLLVYNEQKGYWIEVKTVLTNKRTKSLQSDEIHNLGSGITKIKIEERDKEITYIDSLSILYTDSETNTTREVIPQITNLTQTDGIYSTLHQGEYMEIDLKKLIPANASNVKLKINGYYNILSTNEE